MFVGCVDRLHDREGQPLDRAALQAEMRFAEARGETGAEDLQLAIFEREPELDAVPVKPGGLVTLVCRDRRDAELADVACHFGIIMMRQHRDMTEHVME